MKTFETEKGNIPEGATHTYDHGGSKCGYYKLVDGNWFYWDWCKAWYALIDNQPFYDAIPIPQTNIETPEEKEALDSINSNPIKPREMTQPRFSKCETVFSFSHGERRFILRGIDTDHPQLEVVRHETEVERAERERLEAAYDLYVDFPGSGCICTFEEFVIKPHLASKWLRMVYKTNYRKNSD